MNRLAWAFGIFDGGEKRTPLVGDHIQRGQVANARIGISGKRLKKSWVIAQLLDCRGKVRFGIIHVARPQIVEEVTVALKAEYGDVEILSAAATPVLATHTGIDAWAVSYLVED